MSGECEHCVVLMRHGSCYCTAACVRVREFLNFVEEDVIRVCSSAFRAIHLKRSFLVLLWPCLVGDINIL